MFRGGGWWVGVHIKGVWGRLLIKLVSVSDHGWGDEGGEVGVRNGRGRFIGALH